MVVDSMSFLRDVGHAHRFHDYCPLSTDRWPGRELYFAWRHPIITVLIMFAFVNVLLGIFGYALVAP